MNDKTYRKIARDICISLKINHCLPVHDLAGLKNMSNNNDTITQWLSECADINGEQDMIHDPKGYQLFLEKYRKELNRRLSCSQGDSGEY